MRLVLETSASQFESEAPYHARVMQLADMPSSNLGSYPFESDREYQFLWSGTQIGKAAKFKIWRLRVRFSPALPLWG